MEQMDLGFAGIFRETHRVLLRAILLNKGGRAAAILSALLLAHIAANCSFLSLLDAYDYKLVPEAVGFAYSLYLIFHLLLPLICGAALVLCLRFASLHCADGDSGAFDLLLRNLPRAPLWRLILIVIHVIPLAISYFIFSVAACLMLLLLDPSNNQVVTLPLRVIAGAACLAGAAYASVVLHVSCMVGVLEGAYRPHGVLRRSRALLAGKFRAASAVFLPLDGCFVALQVSLLLLTTEGARGLGRGYQVAAGAAIAVALWAVVVVTLAVQPVVYLVCKNHHHEVVNRGVELQDLEDP